ncbi:hypothetical protein L596_001827 [Steinernema carpocapsae]|uniref:Uncharacterized protein n=1 Tax=Steinernema carpocapsae TaxID=34508 RepID=A0A4U8UR86_STECR|nr:hypothetical protein L596_001827 [Steinernema carpocapsae]
MVSVISMNKQNSVSTSIQSFIDSPMYSTIKGVILSTTSSETIDHIFASALACGNNVTVITDINLEP